MAVKCAVTALDAAAGLAPRRASHSATERRSSPSETLARAMARPGKREPPRYNPRLLVRRAPLPVGGAAVRYSAGHHRAHAWPARPRGLGAGRPRGPMPKLGRVPSGVSGFWD